MSATSPSLRQRWERRSIQLRLLLAVVVLVGVALPVGGAWLAHTYREAATENFDERLEAMLNVIIAGVTFDPVAGQLVYDQALGDPRFDQVYSGWYWQITDDAEQTLASRSLWDQRLPVNDARGATVREITGPRGQRLRLVERDIFLAPLPTSIHVSLAGRDDVLVGDIQEFQRLLGFSLLGLGALLLGVLAAQVHWGLAPLRRMRADLKAVEQGTKAELSTQLPDELAALARSMNAVLARDQRLIERGRHTAGNLAHALKTPVSVLRLQLRQLQPAERPVWETELARIDEAVRHHLARASAVGEGAGLAPIEVGENLAPLLKGLSRLAERRELRLLTDLSTPLKARMDAQDLQELVGNLLDNALRWARGSVWLRLYAQAQDKYAQNQYAQKDALVIVVEDDGPGMSEEECAKALTRGARLDQQRSQSGLGLAIVDDLVRLYHGQLELGRSAAGGLRVTLTLPVVAP